MRSRPVTTVRPGRRSPDTGGSAADEAPTATDFARRALAELGGEAPSRLDSEAVVAARDRVLGDPETLVQLMFAVRPSAEDLWPARGSAALFGTIARVGATAPWLELVRRGLRDGFAAELPSSVAA